MASIAGAGSVLVFLPQILILFAFILALEDSGYLPRAAFLLDRLMGRSASPAAPSFRCCRASPAPSPASWRRARFRRARDRLATIMIAPLMTCSARLPVYTLLIGAFIPHAHASASFNLHGLVLFALYLAGVASAMRVAFALKRTVMRGDYHPLLLELPEYRLPHLRNLAARPVGAHAHLPRPRRHDHSDADGGAVVPRELPGPAAGATGPAIQYSFAGMLGRGLEYLFAPIGFNWQISIALVPGLAAREVAVSALGTVYAMSGASAGCRRRAAARDRPQLERRHGAVAARLVRIRAAVPVDARGGRRETNSWRYPLLMAAYLFALAYLARSSPIAWRSPRRG